MRYATFLQHRSSLRYKTLDTLRQLNDPNLYLEPSPDSDSYYKRMLLLKDLRSYARQLIILWEAETLMFTITPKKNQIPLEEAIAIMEKLNIQAEMPPDE